MAHKIFLSHTHADKQLVEPVAIQLADIFGRDQIFYDSWSIQPGQGIIDQIDKGLEAPDFVFFFVSTKSLQSEIVKLEWQNALFRATNGKIRLIPVRMDEISMPSILTQTAYINMYDNGLEASIRQIVDLCQGNTSFIPQKKFSNLTFSVSTENREVKLVIRASHFMEPNPNFIVLIKNEQEEFTIEAVGYGGYSGGFNPNIEMTNGLVSNGFLIKPMNAALTPTLPVRINLKPSGEAEIAFCGLLHQAGEQRWEPVPQFNPS